MLQDWKSTADILRALKALGVRIALDGFRHGVFESKLHEAISDRCLEDRSIFVRDMTTDPTMRASSAPSSTMGRSLNMGVVAEGIQTRDQLEFLKDRQCPEGRVYFGPPMPARDLTEAAQFGWP